MKKKIAAKMEGKHNYPEKMMFSTHTSTQNTKYSQRQRQ
jgi:hypothetical protein